MPGDFQGGVFALIVFVVFGAAVLVGFVVGIVLYAAGVAEARRKDEPRPSFLAFLGVGALGTAGLLAVGLMVIRGSSGGNQLLAALIFGVAVGATWIVAGALAHRRFRRWLLR